MIIWWKDGKINMTFFNVAFIINYIFPLFPVGNKNDCPSRKVVVTEDAQRFANQMNIPLFETSAKENINVEEMFLTITKMVNIVYLFNICSHIIIVTENNSITHRLQLVY